MHCSQLDFLSEWRDIIIWRHRYISMLHDSEQRELLLLHGRFRFELERRERVLCEKEFNAADY